MMKVWCSSVWYLALPRGDSLPNRSFVEILLLDGWTVEESHKQALQQTNTQFLNFLAEKYRIYLSHFSFWHYNVFNQPLPCPVKEIGFISHILPLIPFRSLAKPKKKMLNKSDW